MVLSWKLQVIWASEEFKVIYFWFFFKTDSMVPLIFNLKKKQIQELLTKPNTCKRLCICVRSGMQFWLEQGANCLSNCWSPGLYFLNYCICIQII
jgi:hypothetical protein